MPICPNCSASELWLQFDFPGLRIKEEAAYPTLSSARRFLGPRISSIVTVGLSGRWDRYMLHFLLDLAIERRLLFIDVNHSPSSFIDDFRHLYYPSLQQWNTAPTAQVPPVYCHIPLKADEFFEFIKKNWYE
jgi:hypothetical protein